MEKIKVFAPATIGNIGPGFDVLGLAIKGIGDIVEISGNDTNKINLKITGKYPDLPDDPDKNTATIAIKEVLNLYKIKKGFDVVLEKNLPAGSGLGSSAASAVAGAFAANMMLGNRLTKEELIMPATIAESAVSGGFFADNTAPSLLGGATLTRSYEPLDVVKLGHIDELILVIITPDIKILTKHARKILPKKVNLADFVSNMANSCLICAAFSKNDYRLFSRCLNDKIIEPVRSSLINGFYGVKNAAILAGADGCAISGSGPTMFAITNNNINAEKIRLAMKNEFDRLGIKSESLITKADNEGSRVIG